MQRDIYFPEVAVLLVEVLIGAISCTKGEYLSVNMHIFFTFPFSLTDAWLQSVCIFTPNASFILSLAVGKDAPATYE